MALQRSFTPGDEFPNLSKHHNVLSKVLTRELYEKLSPLSSKGGYTLDKCIQTGALTKHLESTSLCASIKNSFE